MSVKDKKEIISELLESLFGKEDKISFYFIKKGTNVSDNEAIIPYKTRKKISPQKIKETEVLLQKKTGEADLRLIRWSEVIGKIVPVSRVFKIPFFDSTDVTAKSHPWRLCPIGEHWVRRQPKHLRSGKLTDHDGHCRKNKKSKSEFYHADELKLMSETHFNSLTSDPDAMPIPDSLGYPNGNKYDLLTAGWTKFWNDVLEPEEPLTPDLVKALMATESSFETPKDQNSKDGKARGLIQITESTRKILQNLKGELKDHYIELTVDESRDPVTNIAAGIRWLHYKKKYRERRLKKKATWEEAIIEYKGLAPQIGKGGTADKIMAKIRKHYNRLQKMREEK
ncbi:MAG TPA: transglycosylase SLT domain-containing protein [Bacteriovoracaceae bacterium]|nr:transglycosylase SLT domain-containing protein [Bacteriovoracaceae bacterium]